MAKFEYDCKACKNYKDCKDKPANDIVRSAGAVVCFELK